MSEGSRTAAYVVCLFLATPLVFLEGVGWLGAAGTVGAVVTMWVVAGAWLLKKRSEDPGWDKRRV